MSEAMGFHKRWINIDQIKIQYNNGGVTAVRSYLESPDAIIITDDESEHILDMHRKGCSDEVLDKLINTYICI